MPSENSLNIECGFFTQNQELFEELTLILAPLKNASTLRMGDIQKTTGRVFSEGNYWSIAAQTEGQNLCDSLSFLLDRVLTFHKQIAHYLELDIQFYVNVTYSIFSLADKETVSLILMNSHVLAKMDALKAEYGFVSDDLQEDVYYATNAPDCGVLFYAYSQEDPPPGVLRQNRLTQMSYDSRADVEHTEEDISLHLDAVFQKIGTGCFTASLSSCLEIHRKNNYFHVAINFSPKNVHVLSELHATVKLLDSCFAMT